MQKTCIDKIDNAQVSADGSDLYSTMEYVVMFTGNVPCAHHIIKNKVKRVFVGVLEPANL